MQNYYSFKNSSISGRDQFRAINIGRVNPEPTFESFRHVAISIKLPEEAFQHCRHKGASEKQEPLLSCTRITQMLGERQPRNCKTFIVPSRGSYPTKDLNRHDI